jgi:hypothetical protein
MCDRPPTSSHRRWGHDAQGGVRFGGRLGADAESYVPWGVLAAGLFPMILATLDRRLAHFAFLEKEPRGGVFSLLCQSPAVSSRLAEAGASDR